MMQTEEDENTKFSKHKTLAAKASTIWSYAPKGRN